MNINKFSYHFFLFIFCCVFTSFAQPTADSLNAQPSENAIENTVEKSKKELREEKRNQRLAEKQAQDSIKRAKETIVEESSSNSNTGIAPTDKTDKTDKPDKQIKEQSETQVGKYDSKLQNHSSDKKESRVKKRDRKGDLETHEPYIPKFPLTWLGKIIVAILSIAIIIIGIVVGFILIGGVFSVAGDLVKSLFSPIGLLCTAPIVIFFWTAIVGVVGAVITGFIALFTAMFSSSVVYVFFTSFHIFLINKPL